MKKVLSIILCAIIAFSVVGCSNEQPTEANEAVEIVSFYETLVNIEPMIYYDSSTRIVYYWNGVVYGQSATMPTPYYAPNGLPYRYNPETNSLEQIENQ